MPRRSTTGAKKVDKESTTGHLTPVETVVAPSELANGFDQPFTCDNHGNLYLQCERFGVSGVRKISAKGEHTVLFQPSANPEFRLDGVAIRPSVRATSCISLSFPTRSRAM